MAKSQLLSLLFIILSSALLVSCQDYNELVFSGFVELASTAATDEAIDFSKVEIQLLNSEGKFVDKTFCSQNGFFLLPVNGKNAYDIKVRPPQESTFDPEVISVNLRGKSNEEVAKIIETSLSFKFVGFSLTGDVKVEGSQQSPAGVQVALYDSKNKRVAETLTQEGGHFRFDKVMTGKYRVELDSKDSGFSWRQGEGSLACELSWKNGQDCKGKLVISGFQVKGTISNQNNILGKHLVFLYNEDATVKTKSSLPAVADHPLAAKKQDYVSYSKIDQNGQFTFENVPKGKYFLKVYTSDKDNKIEVEPEEYNFEVDASPVVIENRFAINKFSIRGRVVDREGHGVGGINIILDGQKKATSDAKGFYLIERVPVGTYTLEGQHEHLFFEPVANLELQPTMTSMPDLVLSLVHLCGEVSLRGGSNDDEFRHAKILVYLERQGEKRSVNVEEDGRYCFDVQQGRYNIYPIISNIASTVKQDSLLYPKIREVQITNEPILDVNFYRPRLFIQGEVRLLANVKPSQVEKTKVILTANNGQQKSVSLDKNRQFAFDQVLPGSYRISIENPNFCWKTEDQRVELANSNATNLAFEQAGFAIKYQTSRPLEVQIVAPNGKATEAKLEPDTSSYCVDAAGAYKIIPDTCYQFKESEFTVNTNDEEGLVLEPIGYLVRGEVIASDSIVPSTNETFVQFVVENIHISLTVDNAEPTKRHLLRLQHAKTEDGVHRFNYNYYVPPNSEVTIEARPKTKLSAEAEQFVQNLLFNPTSIKLSVGETCVLNAEEAQLEIRQGLIYVGSVQPAIKDWTLSVYYEDAPEGKDALIETQQKRDSTFKLGPYLDTHKYDIRAEKEGYKFDPTFTEEGYNLIRVNFNAQRLSQLKINVVDDQKKPIPGALLFVSSMAKKNQIKINNYTNEKGVFNTYQLVKGEYFVKAVLKEYSFNPPQTTITIDDGEQKEITVTATRVAYSVFGKIQKLNKAGCEGLKVTAIPQNSDVQAEIAETDASGNYRIKGLIPGKVYEIVPSTEQASQYAIIRPQKTTIVAKPQDILDVDFIGFERKSGTTLFGNVQFDKTYTEEDIDQIETIQVRLFRAGEQEPIRTANVKLFRYFEFSDVQPDNYAIRTLIKRGKNAIPSEHTQYVTSSQLEGEHRVPVNVHISKEKSRGAREALAQGTYLAPILFLIVIFVFLNLDTLRGKYNKFVAGQETNKRKTL